MLKISSRILNKIKDQTPKSVFTKAFSESSSSIDNNNNEKLESPESYILFNGKKVNRTYDRYEFSTDKKPIRTVTNKQREEIRKHQNEIEEKNRDTKKAMVEHHIKKDPKKKEIYEKFYQDYREKEIEQKIHVELSSRDNDKIYDEITLDEPTHPEQQLQALLNQIKIDKQQILSIKESQIMESILDGVLPQTEINEINDKVSNEFERAKKLYIAANHKESFNIFSKLSTQFNHGMSNVFLGNMYYIGSSVTEVDYHQAFQHFYSAAIHFKIPVAFGMIGELIYRGLVDKIDGKQLPIDNTSGDSFAKVYFSLASQFGLKSSTEQLAFIFMNGGKKYKNLNGAIQMLKRLATRNNDINAITTIGALLLDDHPTISKELWIFASKMGDSNAQTQLGRYYYHHSSNPDYNNALLLWSSASKKGDKDAQFYLGGMYNIGLVVEKSIIKSLQLYELSAKGGNSNAQFLIGKAYLNGEGIAQNIELGNKYLKESADQNNETAIIYLNDLKNNEFKDDDDNTKH